MGSHRPAKLDLSVVAQMDKDMLKKQIENMKYQATMERWPLSKHRRNARVHRGAREDGPADPRTRQEEQPVGREGQMRHHVKTTVAIFTVSLSFSVCLSVSLSLCFISLIHSFRHAHCRAPPPQPQV